MRIEPRTIELLAEFVPEEDLRRARVVTGRPWRLLPRALKMSAITFSPFIIYRDGRYQPSTAKGLALLAHEIVHMGQARERGAIRFYASYLWGNVQCRFQHDRHRLEIPAIALQREVRAVLDGRGGSGSW